MSIRFHVVLGVLGLIIGLGIGRCSYTPPKVEKCDCSYERFASDAHARNATFIVDVASALISDAVDAAVEDVVVACSAKLRHCGCLREEVPESFEH